MNTPNPLIPQGTFLQNRSRSQIRIAVFTILAVHMVLLSALLMAGCKKTTDATADAGTAYTNIGFATPTNPALSETSIVQQVPNVITSNIVTPNPPTSTEPEKEHVVVKGDSFYTLAKKYGVTSRAIADANPGVDSTKLKIGQKIKIPSGSANTAAVSNGSSSSSEKTYTVKSGDNLMKIAKSYGVSVPALRTANALKTDQIKVGQKLKIPTSAAGGAGSSSASVSSGTNPAP